MEAIDTVMSKEQVNDECGDGLGYGIEDWLKGLLMTQAEISFPKGIDKGRKEVVEIVRDWETTPSVEFNRKYKVKLIDNTEDETLLEIIERYLGIGK